ncbi:polysaccharide lyase family 26 protein [Aspergillus saccharolyticus JOP 1030-1]|uniref:PcRGLX/YetA-like central beta-sandwich domain-containing protein n=1 Tax=Aspergillus saccharolyticus JOP 1030-1 TaxID=1450539 RepID=A0A319AKD3_9EURO|nr:hypothetical protein BP01DRAFT_380914 [Aspergillus saccharolyticus JOP 1030-1]PYH47072.1 hypothetical protein BP01DRAFT_380914 [Aspergillus saccharolyticus JOP 1030-1]
MLCSPLAEPLNTRPYHDGLRLDTYKEQPKALKTTYEDCEPDFGIANGIGRTTVFYIWLHGNGTPSDSELSAFPALKPSTIPESEEASWIATNEAARYGVSAIFNLANIRQYLD